MAHDALNVATLLYSSNQNPSRDDPGMAVKFTVPTVTHGKVYVGAAYQVSVFGGLSGQPPPQPQTATPVLSPGSETFSSAIQVTITDGTQGAAIYYTTDGSTPTSSSTQYAGSITVTTTETVNAIATAPGYTPSAVASATYTLSQGQTAPPTFSPAGGSYLLPQHVSISDASPGATIYYTTDGSTPTTASIQYTGAFWIFTTTTVQAIAVAPGWSESSVASATYNVLF
jgi:hypothetical protein